MNDVIFANGRLFDGLRYHHDHAVGVRGDMIYAVGPLDRVREEMSQGAESSRSSTRGVAW